MSKKTVPATTGSNLPAHLQGAREDAGKGTSQRAEDNIVPLIYLLQSNSPQVARKNPNYIDGAKPGDIWQRGAPTVIDGDEGCLVQPVYFSSNYVEWRPNRGGFVARHIQMPSDAQQEEVMKEGRPVTVWRRANGNDIVHTREHVVLIDGTPFVIPMSGTKHTNSRMWMSLQNQKQFDDGQIMPSWACKYLMRSIAKANDIGDFFVYQFDDLPVSDRYASEEEFRRGRALYHAFASGAKQAEAPLDPEAGDGGREAPF
jgi:hypothetical protein